MRVTQVEGITMQEARNAMHYADFDSVSGVAANAAFTMGVSMGGRRPRTLTAIRLEHIKLSVGATQLGGKTVLVPQTKVTGSPSPLVFGGG